VKKEFVYSLEELHEVVEFLYQQMNHCRIFTLTGPLGAGKTTLLKKLFARCGIKDVITSPTFTYVSIYHDDKSHTFYHFDLYRLQSLAEFMEMGFDEYLSAPQSWSFIEWPEILKSILGKKVCSLTLDYVSEEKRKLIFESHEQ
jgi:tRNA threonylcarbamoyladenosine biosynthesis protein TsaE